MEDLGNENNKISGRPPVYKSFSGDRRCNQTAACAVYASQFQVQSSTGGPVSVWFPLVAAATRWKPECVWGKDNMALILKLTTLVK